MREFDIKLLCNEEKARTYNELIITEKNEKNLNQLATPKFKLQLAS